MGRVPRVDIGNQFYHILNRANARLHIFKKDKDFEAFEKILEQAREKYSRGKKGSGPFSSKYNLL